MFGSTNPFGQSSTFGQSMSSPFGQTSTNPFGSPSQFGQPANQNNPFAPKPFGSPTSNPFGAQTGGSIFGGTSTGVFGQPSTPLFGASSTPAFGASSSPAFGASSSSAFGGSSLFGQKPAFGGFNSSPGQTSSPFGATFQQTQSAFGSPAFGSTTPFGATSTPAFGQTSTPAFGQTSTPAFGQTSTPAFGQTSTPAFGATSTPFGASSTPAFGAASTPAFGSTSTSLFGNTVSAFGASSNSLFSQSSTPAFGASSTPTFGAASTPAFGASSTSSFSFGSTPAFGQTGSTFGSTPFGASPSPFGGQATTPTFGSPGFGQQPGTQAGGSRIAAFVPTTEEGGTGAAAKLESISAMPVYKDKSHEELRWEDYQRGDKGGPNPAGTTTGGFGITPAQPTPFGATGTFGQTSSNLFTATTASNPFGPKTTQTFGATGFGSTPSIFTSASSSPFGTSTPFGSTASTATPSIFGAPSTGSPFGAASSSPSLFGSTPSSSAFGTSTPSPFGSTFGQTQSSGLFQSSAQPFGASPSPFGQPAANTGFQQQSQPGFGSTLFSSTPSSGFGGNLFSNSTPSIFTSTTPGFGQSAPTLSTPFQQAAPTQTSGGFSFPNFGQTQPAASGGGFGSGFGSGFNSSTFGQQLATNQQTVMMQPTIVTNPFGTLPAMPTMSIGRVGSAPSVQYGISSLPVPDKSPVTRTSTMLVPRHLSQRRIKLPPRRYNGKSCSPKVPYFADEDEVPSTPKADAFFIPRENPRSLIVRPIEQWPPRVSPDSVINNAISRDGSDFVNQNGNPDQPSAPVINEHFDEYDDGIPEELDEHRTVQNGTVGNKISIKEPTNNGGDSKKTSSNGVITRMPKLTQSDYFTIPRIPELAAKERSESGYIKCVKDFTIGREGYGSIKFYGETDLTGLDLDSLIQFGNREVIVYQDESVKPPVGKGLNKPAEVTLLNIKWINKKSGEQYLQREKVERYKEVLRTKSDEQGAEFISYDAVAGEWKFKVKHF